MSPLQVIQQYTSDAWIYGAVVIGFVLSLLLRLLVKGTLRSGWDRHWLRTAKQVREDRRARRADPRRGFDPNIGRFDVEEASIAERLLGLNDIGGPGMSGWNVTSGADPSLSPHHGPEVDRTIERLTRKQGLPTPSWLSAAAPDTAPAASAGDAALPEVGGGELVGTFDGRVGGATALQREVTFGAGTYTFELMWIGDPIQFAIASDGEWIFNVECPAGPHREEVQLREGTYLLYVVDHDPHYGEFQDVRVSVWFEPAAPAQAA